MKSNGTKFTAHKLSFVSTILGAVAWIVGFFTYFGFGQYRGLYVFFALVSIALLVMDIEMAGISSRAEGNPMKRSVYGSAVCFVLQLLFFGALALLGPAALPWAGSLFFCVTALYLICPVLVFSSAKKHGL